MSDAGARLGHRLLRWGVVLFLLGLLTGFVIPMMGNPRMGLTSHLEGVMNGTVLMVLGLMWPKLRLSDRGLTLGFWLAIYGTYANWATTLFAGLLGVGEKMAPIAATGYLGSDAEEMVVAFGFISLSVAMVGICVMTLSGLRGAPDLSE